MARETTNLLFLKSTGAFIGQLTDDVDTSVLDLTKFAIKPVDLDVNEGEYWYGDLFNGEVRSRAVKPVITEQFLRYQTNTKILKQYPIHTQLNILLDMIDKNATVKTPEFEEFKAFLDMLRTSHNEKKAYYSSNPDSYTWVSAEEEAAMEEAKRTGF